MSTASTHAHGSPSGHVKCLAAALATAGALFAAPVSRAEAVAHTARPVKVSCGQTVTRSTTLANDLIDCPGSGIIIGGDDIELDLNGHTINGDGKDDDGDEYGIDNSAGHDRVTIEGGSIRAFVEGVAVRGASAGRIRGLSTSRQFHAGIIVLDSVGMQIERNASNAECGGIVVAGGSHDVRIQQNTVSGESCGGISLFDSDHVRVSSNVISTPGKVITGDAAGISVLDHSDHNVVEYNSVSGQGFVAVIADGGVDNVVQSNRISRSHGGIILTGDDNTLADNLVSNISGGCDGCGFGISFEGGQRNVIEHNIVDHTQGDAGSSSPPSSPRRRPAINNTVRFNVARAGTVDGILVESTATGTVVDRNFADANGDDGIDVDAATTTLTGNVANHNRDFGIEAVAGVRDGGGNRARWNGNRSQCAEVICR